MWWEYIKEKITQWCLKKEEVYIGHLHDRHSPQPCEIYEDLNKIKFIERSSPHDIFVETPTGYSPICHIHKTVQYDIWTLGTEHHMLHCADRHIVITEEGRERYVRDLIPGDKIQTIRGIEEVVHAQQTETTDQMYDLELTDEKHLYYTNGIVSHNSTTVSAYILWYSIFNFEKTTLIASNKEKGAKEMIGRIRYAYEHLPMWLKPGIQEDGWNKHSLGFDNNSRIESTATSEDSGRGMSISLLYLDEFAFVPHNIAEEFWASVAPTLSGIGSGGGGDCIITSTPNGDINLFSQLWRGADLGANGFASSWIKWDEPPGRGEKFKEEQIAKIGYTRWEQEYECKFLSTDTLLISSIALNNETKRMDNEVPDGYMIKKVKFWKKIKTGATYIVGVDPATGVGNDFSVITAFEFPSMEQVAEWRSNLMSPPETYNVLKNVLRFIELQGAGTIYFSVENNGVGEGIISLYEADETAPVTPNFISDGGAKNRGFNTTQKSKIRACIRLKEMIEKGDMKINSMVLLKELKSYARHRGSYKAQVGATDDSVSACLVIVRIIERIAQYDQNAYDKVYSYENDNWAEQTVNFDEDDPNQAPSPMVF